MTRKTENHQLNSELTLRDSSHSPLTVRAVSLSLTKQEDQLIECRLTFSVNPELYQRIDTQSLFNLKPEIRGSFIGEFLPSPDIKIEISLKPDLLPHLVEHAANQERSCKVSPQYKHRKTRRPPTFDGKLVGVIGQTATGIRRNWLQHLLELY